VPNNLAVDILLADAPRDQLSVLRAEVEDQNFFIGNTGGCEFAWSLIGSFRHSGVSSEKLETTDYTRLHKAS
jgi:hypothetical protein